MSGQAPPANWSALRPLRKLVRPAVYFCVLTVAMELLGFFVLPKVLPESLYFWKMLPINAVLYAKEYVEGERSIEPDLELGWSNRPNSEFLNGSYDSLGSRSCKGIDPERPKPIRALFVGDSRIHGDDIITNDTTINAFLEDDTIETLNFASASYRLDQCYLAEKRWLERLHPQALVVGVDSTPGGALDSVFMPFISLSSSRPILKPRAFIDGDQLRWFFPDSASLLRDVPSVGVLLDTLKEYDNGYENFEWYKRHNCLLLLGIWQKLCKKIDKYSGHSKELDLMRESNTKCCILARRIIAEMKAYADEHSVQLIFVLTPIRDEYEDGHTHEYCECLSTLHSLDVQVLDVLKLLEQSQDDVNNVYLDSLHFTPKIHKLIADALREMILRDRPVLTARSESTSLAGGDGEKPQGLR